MSAPMPQAVVERVIEFMRTERTGTIQLDFRSGRLLGVKVNEVYRVRNGDLVVDDGNRLDDDQRVAQDSER